jgi:hypothetical protein
LTGPDIYWVFFMAVSYSPRRETPKNVIKKSVWGGKKMPKKSTHLYAKSFLLCSLLPAEKYSETRHNNKKVEEELTIQIIDDFFV